MDRSLTSSVFERKKEQIQKEKTQRGQASVSLSPIANEFIRDRKKRGMKSERGSEPGRLISSELLFQRGRVLGDTAMSFVWVRTEERPRARAHKRGEDESPPESARDKWGH